jgi:hypothetical protein
MNDTYDITELRNRLREALSDAGISHRDASIKAGASSGYVHSIIKGTADPGTKKLAEICQANNISFPYVLLGFEITPETERLVRLFSADPGKRDSILSLLGD